MSPFLIEGFDFRHQRKIAPPPISDEGVAFSADSVPITNEGVAFSVAFQAKGLHFRPLVRDRYAFLREGSIFYPRRPRMCTPVGSARQVSECVVFSIENRYSSVEPKI